MEEIYWITRLDAICNFLSAVAVVCFMISVVTCIFAMCNKFEADDYEEGGKYYNCHMQKFKMFLNYFKRFTFAVIVISSINFFIPTTNEALMIYGVGGTIDYVKSNKIAKQLPDKCIKALDKWADNLNEEKQENKQK